jgi:hypothetical protein
VTKKLDNKGLGVVKAVTPTGATSAVNPSDDLAVDRSILLEEMAEQPSLFAYYAQLSATANAAAKQARFERHCLEEDLYEELRQQYPNGGRGGVSEARINQLVQKNPKMRLAHAKVMNKEQRAEKLAALTEAFRQRSSMLQSINSTLNKDSFGEKPIESLKRKAAEIAKNSAR